MSDIYGSKQGSLLQFGLADADDPEDFNTKLESLQDVWEAIVPGFHAWFKKRWVDIFQQNIIGSVKDRLCQDEKFFNNRLEIMHKLQKKKITEEDISKEMIEITNMLREWTASYRNEATKSLRGLGKYRLAPGFQQFFVDPVRWYQWSTERQRQHCDAFFHHKPKISETFARPSNAGLKGNGTQKRRRDESEADLFVDRFSNMPAKKVTPPSQPPQNERNRKIRSSKETK
eukprot:Seg1234.19 transcript_id=Seg1234.19/GoldUCD/mRNA.D3Y31 product="hypothetical protein" protein_id=Seg1234.19/GoldUCD/D3Y31